MAYGLIAMPTGPSDVITASIAPKSDADNTANGALSRVPLYNFPRGITASGPASPINALVGLVTIPPTASSGSFGPVKCCIPL